jgi:hypothetical protein
MKLPQGRQVVNDVEGLIYWPVGQVCKHKVLYSNVVHNGILAELTVEPDYINYAVAEGFAAFSNITNLPNPMIQFLKIGLYIEFTPRLVVIENDA